MKWSELSNEVTTDSKCIMAELRKFYSDLYTPRSLKTETECMDYLHSLNPPKLSNDDKLPCEGKLTLQECWTKKTQNKNLMAIPEMEIE